MIFSWKGSTCSKRILLSLGQGSNPCKAINLLNTWIKNTVWCSWEWCRLINNVTLKFYCFSMALKSSTETQMGVNCCFMSHFDPWLRNFFPLGQSSDLSSLYHFIPSSLYSFITLCEWFYWRHSEGFLLRLCWVSSVQNGKDRVI